MVVKTTTRRGEVLELNEKSVSKKQQRLFGLVRAAQKGTLKGKASPQVQRIASSMKKKEVKKIIEKHENNIDALAKEISEKYGLGYVE